MELPAQTFYQTDSARSRRRACLKIDTSMSVLFAVQQPAGAVLPLPPLEPPPRPSPWGERRNPILLPQRRKATWWLGEKVYSISTVTNKELLAGQPQQRQLARRAHGCWEQLRNRCSRKHNLSQTACAGTPGAAGSGALPRELRAGRGTAASLLRRQCLVGGKRGGGRVPSRQGKRSRTFLRGLEQPRPR